MPEILQNWPISISRAPLKALRLEGEWGTDIKVLLHDVFQWVCLLLGSVLIYHMTIILQNLQFTFFLLALRYLGVRGGRRGWLGSPWHTDLMILWCVPMSFSFIGIEFDVQHSYNSSKLTNLQVKGLPWAFAPPPWSVLDIQISWYVVFQWVSLS